MATPGALFLSRRRLALQCHGPDRGPGVTTSDAGGVRRSTRSGYRVPVLVRRDALASGPPGDPCVGPLLSVSLAGGICTHDLSYPNQAPRSTHPGSTEPTGPACLPAG